MEIPVNVARWLAGDILLVMKGNIVHVCNRGIDKGSVFRGVADYKRFIEGLYRFNNKGGALRFQGTDFFAEPPIQEPIVDILLWSLLPNHYHLLLHERVDGGVIDFVKRIGNGYTKYINMKYERSGYLFQNKAKMVGIKNNSQFVYIPFYVALNPLDLFDKNWRTNGAANPKKAIAFLMSYQWSNLKHNAHSIYSCITNPAQFYALFDTTYAEFKKELTAYITREQMLPPDAISPPVNVAR